MNAEERAHEYLKEMLKSKEVWESLGGYNWQKTMVELAFGLSKEFQNRARQGV